MRRPSLWLMLVVLLPGVLLIREPRFAAAEERFLSWLVKYSQSKGPAIPLTVVEIGADPLMTPSSAQPAEKGAAPTAGSGVAISPLEFALFLQSILDFQPSVVAFENVLKWRDRDKDQEQVFLDQAMRVPKLLLASELGNRADPDGPWSEIRGFADVTGKRGELVEFSSVVRQPNEDLRLVSTTGYVNVPDEVSTGIRVPLLFQYRGEVVPSFPLQAILLWLKATPEEVKIVLGDDASFIALPQDRRIPIQADGTLLIHPHAAQRARRISLNELLLAAQQRDTGNTATAAVDLKDQIVLARTPANPLSPPDLFAATIATIQGKNYLHRVSRFVDYGILFLIAVAAGLMPRLGRFDLLLCGIAATAAYCLIALGTISRWNVWLPGILPLGAIWVSILLAILFREKKDAAREATIGIPPPIA